MKNYIVLALLALAGNAVAANKRVDCGPVWTPICTGPRYGCTTCDDYGEGQVQCGAQAPDLTCSTICRCV